MEALLPGSEVKQQLVSSSGSWSCDPDERLRFARLARLHLPLHAGESQKTVSWEHPLTWLTESHLGRCCQTCSCLAGHGELHHSGLTVQSGGFQARHPAEHAVLHPKPAEHAVLHPKPVEHAALSGSPAESAVVPQSLFWDSCGVHPVASGAASPGAAPALLRWSHRRQFLPERCADQHAAKQVCCGEGVPSQ